MPWYKIKPHLSWKTGGAFLVLWIVFFVGLWGMMVFSGVFYRLCEIRYVGNVRLVRYGEEDRFTEEALSAQVRGLFQVPVKVRMIQNTNILFFFPSTILSDEDLLTLDTHVRTNFFHVKWLAKEVRVVPQLSVIRRVMLLVVLSFVMALGVMIAWFLRREE